MMKRFCIGVMVILCAAGCARQGSVRQTPVVTVIKDCAPSVVNISTERTVLLQHNPEWKGVGNFFDEFYKGYFLKSTSAMKLTGVGSGVIVSKDGLIVTNAHVVNMASKIYVIMHDGKTHEAALAAVNVRNDLALLKITAGKPLQPIALARDVMIGETVVSIGNPYGLENSVTVGVVSGLDRRITVTETGQVVLDNLIQTDASINIGSSGGALLNLDGDLLGINLAVVQGAQSLGFAIAFDKIQSILNDYHGYFKQKEETKKKAE